MSAGWEDLETLLADEMSNNTGTAPLTYKRMQELRKVSQ